LTLTQYRRIIEFAADTAYFLKTWSYFGEVYHDVAVVPTRLTFEQDGQRLPYHWEAHLVKEGGLWRWFREPMTGTLALDVGSTAEGLASEGGPWPPGDLIID
jgi:hypothetical protein